MSIDWIWWTNEYAMLRYVMLCYGRQRQATFHSSKLCCSKQVNDCGVPFNQQKTTIQKSEPKIGLWLSLSSATSSYLTKTPNMINFKNLNWAFEVLKGFFKNLKNRRFLKPTFTALVKWLLWNWPKLVTYFMKILKLLRKHWRLFIDSFYQKLLILTNIYWSYLKI